MIPIDPVILARSSLSNTPFGIPWPMSSAQIILRLGDRNSSPHPKCGVFFLVARAITAKMETSLTTPAERCRIETYDWGSVLDM
jgi:hypothetical protein